VLFGISAAGGIINQTSLVANTYQDNGRVRYSFGTSSRDRAEFRYNKVLIEDKLAVVVAGLNQDNGHWRRFIQQDKERYYTAMTWRPTEKITIRANYEDGFEHRTSIQQGPITDFGLPWYDYSQVTPLEDITFNPFRGNGTGARVTNATRVFGIDQRDGNPRGFSGNGNNRFTFIENDGTFFNAAGRFLTRGYNRAGIVPADGSPTWPADSNPNPPRPIRINDQSILPYHLNPGGPDFYRESDFSSYSVFADFQVNDNWFFNIQLGNQEVRKSGSMCHKSREHGLSSPLMSTRLWMRLMSILRPIPMWGAPISMAITAATKTFPNTMKFGCRLPTTWRPKSWVVTVLPLLLQKWMKRLDAVTPGWVSLEIPIKPELLRIPLGIDTLMLITTTRTTV
jgi:hypothetical protein